MATGSRSPPALPEWASTSCFPPPSFRASGECCAPGATASSPWREAIVAGRRLRRWSKGGGRREEGEVRHRQTSPVSLLPFSYFSLLPSPSSPSYFTSSIDLTLLTSSST